MKKNRYLFSVFCFITIPLVFFFLFFGSDNKTNENENLLYALRIFKIKNSFQTISLPELKPKVKYDVNIVGEGYLIYSAEYGGYRYGPSIVRYEDGSMDMWLSSEGNSSSEWDWITYRHSDDGENWSSERVVLRPTPGSDDRCSVCDPGVVFFNNYYYLAYTSTSDRSGKGMNNSAFVARSRNPEGPYEKWNGTGWGGDPKAMIPYEGDPEGWGIGEVSFVIKDKELFIYYTYFDLNGGMTELAKADLDENWPSSIRPVSIVYSRAMQDSMDIVYAEDLNLFLGFAIENRMSESSKLVLCISEDGTKFEFADKTNEGMKEYAHNVGISKDINGHINTQDEQLIGYAYGKNWGRWSARIQNIVITHSMD